MNPEHEYGQAGAEPGDPDLSARDSGYNQAADSQTHTDTSAFFAKKRAGDDRRIGSWVRIISDLSSNTNGSNQTRPAYAGALVGAKDREQAPTDREGVHSQTGSEIVIASSRDTHLEHFSQAPLDDERQKVDLDEVEEPVILAEEPAAFTEEILQIPASPLDNQIIEVNPKMAISEQISNANSVVEHAQLQPPSPSARVLDIEARSQDSAMILLSLTPTSQMSSEAKNIHEVSERDALRSKFNRYLSTVSNELLSRTQERLGQ